MFRLLRRHRSHLSARVARGPGLQSEITLRIADDDDDPAITRLAALYDRARPSGPLLLAEVDGQLQAALTLAGDRELMEPYRPTAALVELLALRARHLRDQMIPEQLAGAGHASTEAAPNVPSIDRVADACR